MTERPKSLFGMRAAAANITADRARTGAAQATPDLSYRATAARNWEESKPRILGMEQRHTSLLGLMRKQGYPEDHPGIAYHQDMIAKAQREREHYDSVLKPREPQTATVEQGMESRAWKYLGKRDEDDD